MESGADRVSSRPGDCEWRGGWVIHAEAVISSVTGGVYEHDRMAAQEPRDEKGENMSFVQSSFWGIFRYLPQPLD